MSAVSIESSPWSMMKDVFDAENDEKKDLLHDVIPAIMKCMQEHRLSFQDIERGLRENHCVTHLVARQKKLSCGTIEYPKGTSQKYCIYFTESNKEILKESKSYDENFQKLAVTGILAARRDPDTDAFTSWHQFMSGAATMDRGDFMEQLQQYKVPGKRNGIRDNKRCSS